jgi:hypothetical protein
MELTGGLVKHETQYFADPFNGAPSRAALAEPIPAVDRSQAGTVVCEGGFAVPQAARG